MDVIRYRFGEFCLDLQARELTAAGELVALPASHLDCLAYLIRHRDRPVGRDELAAAVWGRIDVSDVSISHAIVRLRKLLGDTGAEQQAIRTVTRVGYRWLLSVVEEPADNDHPAGAGTPASAAAVDAVRSGWMRHGLWLVLLLLLLAALAFWYWLQPSSSSDHATSGLAEGEGGGSAALVLPVVSGAGRDWSWLRLGMMDLIGNRLRDAGLAVTPSETVVSLVTATRLPDAIDAWPDASLAMPDSMVIRPEAIHGDGTWHVRLHYRERGQTHVVEASHVDVLTAARQATDALILRGGRVPAPLPDGSAGQLVEQTARRIQAAVLAGQLELARRLIDEAPEETRGNPEIMLSQAAIDFFAGNYPATIEVAQAVLDSQPANAETVRVRARALYQLGTARVRMRELDAADAAFAQVIDLLGDHNESGQLAAAFAGRGVVAGLRLQLDEATRLLGRARVLHQMANDAFGVVRVDLNLAAIALDRGQPGTALPILEKVIVQIERMAVPEARIYALRAMVDTYLMLLRAQDAFDTSERFWPAEAHVNSDRSLWWLYLSRAVSLTALGQLDEASRLVATTLSRSDPEEDRFVRTEMQALSAAIALLRGDNDEAAELALAAMTPVLEAANRRSHAATWLTRTRALQRAGRIEEAAAEVARMRAWSDDQPADWRSLLVVLAQAEQAHAEGRMAQALETFAAAMALAEAVSVPENLVVVGESWIDALIQAGELDQASVVGGRLAPWADQDWRAAWTQAKLYRAIGRPDQARRLERRAQELAGERVLPKPLVPVP